MLAGTIPAVASQTSQGSAAAQRVMADLERAAPDPALVRYAWARRLIGGEYGPPAAQDRTPGMLALAEAAAMGSGIFSRRALVSLGEIEFEAGRYAQARDHFATLVQRYPGSDFAWMAALRIGQAEQALGRHDDAARAFLEGSQRFASVPFARVLGAAYAARVLEASGAFDQALVHYREAMSAWTHDLDTPLGARGPFSRERAARLEEDPAVVTREAIVRRVDQLSTFLSAPGGRDLEHGRWLHGQGRSGEAVSVLEDVALRHSGTPTGIEATAILHRARLDAALALADTANPAADAAAALKVLDTLSGAPFDPAVGIAGIVSATIRMLQGAIARADQDMHAVLRRWVEGGTRFRTAPTRGTVQGDTLAVRDALFLPKGGGVLTKRWNAHEWPEQLPTYLVAPSELRVTRPGTSAPVRVDVSRQPPGLSNVVFMAPDDVAYLVRVVPRLGGTRRREPAAVMEVPHQPVGGAMSILQWWNRFFPARPGHWGGFEVLSYPSFSSLEFTNAERTRALVPIRVGYSGGTVVLEKVNGVWTMRDLVTVWIE
jgi:tetratricopeptide (TPR) repeat protein